MTRFTLGSKIDRLYLETIEYMLIAGYTARERKLVIVQQASAKLDTLKFFLKIAWQAKALSPKKYAELSAPVAEIGKMLGGWHKQLTSE
ncbi:MAG: four helix bundle protein [Patescibacteria group bacterium]